MAPSGACLPGWTHCFCLIEVLETCREASCVGCARMIALHDNACESACAHFYVWQCSNRAIEPKPLLSSFKWDRFKFQKHPNVPRLCKVKITSTIHNLYNTDESSACIEFTIFSGYTSPQAKYIYSSRPTAILYSYLI